ncbi:hypothetical protein N2152v2_010322 [Parachlorella kessleri]
MFRTADVEVLTRKESSTASISPRAVRVRARAGAEGMADGSSGGHAALDRTNVTPRPPLPRHHLAQRLRSGLLLLLNLGLLFVLVNLLWVVPVGSQDLFGLYYAPLFPLVIMLWFWTAFVAYCERRHVRYEVCFSSEDQKYLMHSDKLFLVSNVLTAIVLGSGVAFLFHSSVNNPYLASYQPPILYLGLLAFVLNPTNVLFKETRLFFSSTAWRVFTPLRTVTWADFLLADVLTSLAKPLSDTERAVCHLMTGPVMSPIEERCGSASLVIPVGLALPYLWRFVQCIRVYLDTGARPQIWNAVKYSTAFPVIILSSMQYHVDRDQWHGFYRPLWLAAALLNSCYSYFWDVERDWEIQLFSVAAKQRSLVATPVFQSQLLYPKPFYLYLMSSNFLLRLAWTHKLSPHLRKNQLMALTFVVLECFRRFQWLFVRIEVELRKIQAYRPEVGILVPPAGHKQQQLHHPHSDELAPGEWGPAGEIQLEDRL